MSLFAGSTGSAQPDAVAGRVHDEPRLASSGFRGFARRARVLDAAYFANASGVSP